MTDDEIRETLRLDFEQAPTPRPFAPPGRRTSRVRPTRVSLACDGQCLLMAHSRRAKRAMDVRFEGKNGHLRT